MEFTPSTPDLDKKVSESFSFEDIRSLAKASLTEQGFITQDVHEDGNWGARPTGRQIPSAPDGSALPASGFKYEREFRYHPSSGRRSLMLRANTMEDLLALERQMEKTI